MIHCRRLEQVIVSAFRKKGRFLVSTGVFLYRDVMENLGISANNSDFFVDLLERVVMLMLFVLQVCAVL